MPPRRQPRSPLYRLTAFGITNPMVLWGIANGSLDGYCAACNGRGFTLRRPCRWLEAADEILAADGHARCDQVNGCRSCRSVCAACRGRRLAADDDVRVEDFGDTESLVIARALMPGLDPSPRPRIDMNARAL